MYYILLTFFVIGTFRGDNNVHGVHDLKNEIAT